MRENRMSKLLPVFLVGFQRSGTNMTVGTLGKNSKIELFNEGDKRAFTNFKLKELPEIYQLLEKKRDDKATIALFKPISDTPKSLFWLEEIPQLKILFCFRNYSDVVNSQANTFGKKGANLLRNYLMGMQSRPSLLRELYGETRKFNSLDILEKYYDDQLGDNSVFALSWLFMNNLYFDLQLEEHLNVLPVCYEETVSKPKFVFKGICKFLGITFHPQMIDGIHGKSVKKNMAPEIDKEIERECRLKYTQLVNDTDRKYKVFTSRLSRFLGI